jgi:hypothetical protein
VVPALLQRAGAESADGAVGDVLAGAADGPAILLPPPRSGGARDALRALFERLLP